MRMVAVKVGMEAIYLGMYLVGQFKSGLRQPPLTHLRRATTNIARTDLPFT
jgi:hypothetical protein